MEKKIFSLNKNGTLHGLIVRACEGVSKNPQYKLPTIADDCLIILPKDIKGSNRIDILKETIPLLASSSIKYINQPLFGIFAPTLERAEEIIKKIEITYQDIDETDQVENKKEISFEDGDFQKELTNILEENTAEVIEETKEEEAEGEQEPEKKNNVTYKSFSSKIKFNRVTSTTNQTTKVIATLDKDILNIYSPTQWPALVENAVSNVCGYSKKKIIVHKEKTYTKKDEMLIQPAILSSIAALAALKSKKNVFIHDNLYSIRPETTIERETWYSVEDKKTIIEKINVTIDQGATQLFSQEISKQYIAGLVPLYDLKAISINFNFISSKLEPAHFFGGLGYVNAIASTQTHTTKLGKTLNLSPFFWISQSLNESSIHKNIMEVDSLQDQKAVLQDLVERSFFNRKYAAYKVNSALNKRLSTFTPYARGVGLAIAPSISGFSSSHETYSSPKIKLTLNFDGKVELNTSFFNNSKGSEIWKQIISQELDIKKEDVEFSQDGPDLIDSGPSVLSSNSGIMATQVKQACKKINEKRFIEGLPISVTIGGSRKNSKAKLFTSHSWISLIIETSVDPITLEPIVYSVWANCFIGELVDESSFISNLKQVIINCLVELGAKIAQGDDFNIDIKIEHKYENISDSITSGLKGVVTAAFNTALEMALNIDNETLPISSESILSIIGDSL
jgi:xanthine dehydrogenase molybdopterin-binding subunit B